MANKPRSEDQTAISVSLSKDLLGDVDVRARTLGLSRSQYFAVLARNDVATGGSLKLIEIYPDTVHGRADAKANSEMRTQVARSSEHTAIINEGREASLKRNRRSEAARH